MPSEFFDDSLDCRIAAAATAPLGTTGGGIGRDPRLASGGASGGHTALARPPAFRAAFTHHSPSIGGIAVASASIAQRILSGR